MSVSLIIFSIHLKFILLKKMFLKRVLGTIMLKIGVL